MSHKGLTFLVILLWGCHPSTSTNSDELNQAQACLNGSNIRPLPKVTKNELSIQGLTSKSIKLGEYEEVQLSIVKDPNSAIPATYYWTICPDSGSPCIKGSSISALISTTRVPSGVFKATAQACVFQDRMDLEERKKSYEISIVHGFKIYCGEPLTVMGSRSMNLTSSDLGDVLEIDEKLAVKIQEQSFAIYDLLGKNQGLSRAEDSRFLAHQAIIAMGPELFASRIGERYWDLLDEVDDPDLGFLGTLDQNREGCLPNLSLVGGGGEVGFFLEALYAVGFELLKEASSDIGKEERGLGLNEFEKTFKEKPIGFQEGLFKAYKNAIPPSANPTDVAAAVAVSKTGQAVSTEIASVHNKASEIKELKIDPVFKERVGKLATVAVEIFDEGTRSQHLAQKLDAQLSITAEAADRAKSVGLSDEIFKTLSDTSLSEVEKYKAIQSLSDTVLEGEKQTFRNIVVNESLSKFFVIGTGGQVKAGGNAVKEGFIISASDYARDRVEVNKFINNMQTVQKLKLERESAVNAARVAKEEAKASKGIINLETEEKLLQTQLTQGGLSTEEKVAAEAKQLSTKSKLAKFKQVVKVVQEQEAVVKALAPKVSGGKPVLQEAPTVQKTQKSFTVLKKELISFLQEGLSEGPGRSTKAVQLAQKRITEQGIKTASELEDFLQVLKKGVLRLADTPESELLDQLQALEKTLSDREDNNYLLDALLNPEP